MSVHVPELYLLRFSKKISVDQKENQLFNTKEVRFVAYVPCTVHRILAISVGNLEKFIEVLIDGQIKTIRYSSVNGKHMRIVFGKQNTDSITLNYRENVPLDEIEHEKNIARQQYKQIFGEDAHE